MDAYKTDTIYTYTFMFRTMMNRKKIEESALYTGKMNHIDLIIDMDILIQESKLTLKQIEVIRLYYFEQYTQEEISKLLKISQQAVLDHLKKAKLKIRKVLERWEDKDE